MYVRAIQLTEAPGLPDGVRAEGFAPGLNVLLGPNASGKSTLARTLRHALLAYPLDDGVRGALIVADDGRRAGRRLLLRGGSVGRWESGEAIDVPGDEARYELSLSSLLGMSSDDDALVRHIVMELEGGDDVAGALAALGKARRHLRAEVQAWEQARRARQVAEREADGAADDERRCEQLQAALADGDAAAAEATLLRDVVALERGMVAAAGAAARRQTLPAGLEALPLDAAERVEAAWRAVEQADRAIAGAQDEAEAAEAALASGLDLGEATLEARLDAADLAVQEEAAAARDASRLGQQAATLEAEAQRLAEGVLAATRVELSDPRLAAGPPASPTAAAQARATLAALEAAWDRRARHRQLQAEAGARIEVLAREQGPSPEQLIGALRAAEALRAWLVADARRGGEGTSRAAPGPFFSWIVHFRTALAAIALALALTSTLAVALGAGALAAWTAAVAGAIAGLVAWAFAAARATPALDAPEIHAQAALAAGARPAAWTPAAVAEAMREAFSVIAAAELGRRAEELTREHERQRAQAAALAAVEQDTIDAALTRLGLDLEQAELGARELASRVIELRERLTQAAGARAEERALRARVAAARGQLAAALAPFAAVLGAPPDQLPRATLVSSARSALQRARAAATRHEQALRTLQERARARHGAAATLEAACAAANVAVPADAGAAAATLHQLRARLALRPQAVALRDERLRAEGEVASARARLAARAADLRALGHGALLDADEATGVLPPADALAAAIQACERRVEAAAAARTELGAARERLRRAWSSTALADAIAAEHAATERLTAARDEELVQAMARRFVEVARAQAAASAGGQTLGRARQWFRAFTRDSFDLGVNEDGKLYAVDPHGARLEPWALSDATHIHLLLALRLASIETSEAGLPPQPLCLDEALSTSDPGRFDAAIAALQQVAAQGRQVLYLTASPLEARAFVDAAQRAGAPAPPIVAVGAEQALASTALPKVVADPNAPRRDETPAAYLARLRVPPLQLWRDAGAAHLAWLLDDEPALLHALALRGVDRVAAWLRAHERGRAEVCALVDDATGAKFAARIRALDAALAALRVGRGRPVSWAEVEASGAITPAFADAIRAAWEGCDGDGEALLAAVAALPRVRAKTVEVLQAHLRELGAVADERRLRQEAVVARAVAAAGDVAVAPWVVRWVAAVRGGSDAAQRAGSAD